MPVCWLPSALVGSVAPITTLAALSGQAAILAGAVGTAVVITWCTRGLLSYAGTVAWALTGVIVSTVQEGIAGVGRGGRTRPDYVLTTAVLAWRHGRQEA